MKSVFDKKKIGMKINLSILVKLDTIVLCYEHRSVHLVQAIETKRT